MSLYDVEVMTRAEFAEVEQLKPREYCFERWDKKLCPRCVWREIHGYTVCNTCVDQLSDDECKYYSRTWDAWDAERNPCIDEKSRADLLAEQLDIAVGYIKTTCHCTDGNRHFCATCEVLDRIAAVKL